MGIDAYLSITGLVWCAFFSLLMIGIVFFIKNKTMKNRDSNTKIFILLYVITVLIMEIKENCVNGFNKD